jgi:hypothetical protein
VVYTVDILPTNRSNNMKKSTYAKLKDIYDDIQAVEAKIGVSIIDNDLEYYVDDTDSRRIVQRYYNYLAESTDKVKDDIAALDKEIEEINNDCLNLVEQIQERVEAIPLTYVKPVNHYTDCVDASAVALVCLVTAAACCVGICAVAASPIVIAVAAILAAIIALGAAATSGLLFFAKKQEQDYELHEPKNLGLGM